MGFLFAGPSMVFAWFLNGFLHFLQTHCNKISILHHGVYSGTPNTIEFVTNMNTKYKMKSLEQTFVYFL